jgi:tetratricopeptide (TPR) repeat protein
MRNSLAAALLLFFSFFSFFPCSTAHAGSVDELLREGRAHEASGSEDLALRRYTEALQLDPTNGDAYLALGALRMKMGDAREAERVYSVALEHVPALRKALAARARARRAQAKNEEAASDLESFATLEADPTAFRELAGWYGEDNRSPAQLGAWRRVLALARDEALVKEARRMVRALQILIAPVDPVAHPVDPDPTRRAIAAIARRGG